MWCWGWNLGLCVPGRGSPSAISSTSILFFIETVFPHYEINEFRNLSLHRTLLSRPSPNKELAWRSKINNSFLSGVPPDLSEALKPLRFVGGKHSECNVDIHPKYTQSVPLDHVRCFLRNSLAAINPLWRPPASCLLITPPSLLSEFIPQCSVFPFSTAQFGPTFLVLNLAIFPDCDLQSLNAE